MVLLTIIPLILVIPISWLIFFLHRRKQAADFLISNFPSEPAHPLFGHVLKMPLNQHAIFTTVEKWLKKHGKNSVFLKPCYEAMLMLSDPKCVEKIVMDTDVRIIKKADPYFLLKSWLGDGLIGSCGEKWQKRRKMLTPAFHFNILERFIEVINKQLEVFVGVLNSRIGTGDFNIHEYTSLFALDVICETSMGISINAQTLSDTEYVNAVKTILDLGLKRFFSMVGWSDRLYQLTPNGRAILNLTRILQNFSNDVIMRRREQLLNQQSIEQSDNVRPNFLDIILKSTIDGKPLTNQEIREEVDTFIFAGYDTTATALSFTLYALSRHKDVQDRLYEVLVSVLGDTDIANIPYSKLTDVRYLDMVIKESLRLYPVIPFIGRKLVKDTVIDGVTVPAGVNVGLMIYRMHHDEDNFPDPEKFDPERFDPSMAINRHSMSFIPFSAGTRNCIGQKYAWMEMRLAIAKLLMHYEFLPAVTQKELLLQGDVILKSGNGIFMRVAERKRRN